MHIPTRKAESKLYVFNHKQLPKMGRNKACGPDDLPIQVIKEVAEMKPEQLTYILQIIMADGIHYPR